jgi:hypothetical protein
MDDVLPMRYIWPAGSAAAVPAVMRSTGSPTHCACSRIYWTYKSKHLYLLNISFYVHYSTLLPLPLLGFHQCCGSGMFIPDPGSEFFPSRISIKEFKYFNPKKWFLSSTKYDPGCSSRIHLGYRIPGSKRHRIPDPDPQHWIPLCRMMLGSNPELLRLRHWQSDALTSRLDLIHIIVSYCLWGGGGGEGGKEEKWQVILS